MNRALINLFSAFLLAAVGGIQSAKAGPALESWPYEGLGAVSLVAAAPVGGHYAVASRQDDRIEVRDIRGDLLAQISAEDLQSAMPWADLSGETFGPCTMSFTPSGRLLFIGVCSASGEPETRDAILRFNMNTKALDLYFRMKIDGVRDTPANFGMVHYNGKLYVGTDHGLYRFAAERNDFSQFEPEQVVDAQGITGLAVDIKSNMLYVATSDNLHRSAIPELSLGTPVAALVNAVDIAYGRTYGGTGNSGLYILRASGEMDFVSSSNLHAGGAAVPSSYTSVSPAPSGLAATACGRMLLATPTPQIMSDDSDTRMDFETFLQSQFLGYIDCAKSCLLGFDNRTPPGFANLTGMEINDGSHTPNSNIRQSVIGWLMLPMLAAGINGDSEAADYIALAAQRTLGLHPDGNGGVMTIDGLMHEQYKSNGEVKDGDGGIILLNQKFTPALEAAADFYPEHEELQFYADNMRSRFKRHGDMYNANKRFTKGASDYGPNRGSHSIGGGGENFYWQDLAAAQDPTASRDYEVYGYDRDQYGYNEEVLIGEPLTSDQPAYQVFGRAVMIKRLMQDPVWAATHRNYYFSSIAIGDDLPSPYMTAWSAGHHPPSEDWDWYGQDTPLRRPANVIHFPALLGFGQFGYTSPAVGVYLAYRDGLARPVWTDSAIGTSPEMVLRYSIDYPDYIEPRIGPADNWFGAIGLANLINPGMIDLIRKDYFIPDGPLVSTADGRVLLQYSRLTPRRVYGSDDGINWIPYGYQLSPFQFDDGVSYVHYKVEDPEGTEIYVANGDLEDGTAGWTTWNDGGSAPYSNDTTGQPHIAGKSLRIVTDSDATISGVRQTLMLAAHLEDTRYILRGVGRTIGSIPAGAEAWLQVDWDDDRDIGNGVLGTEISNKITTGDAWEEFYAEIKKPIGADYAHVSLVVEGVDGTGGVYVFDGISLVMLGADRTGINGGFEEGSFTNWLVSGPEISLTSSSGVSEGSYACKFEIGPGNTDEVVLTRPIDVSSEDNGLRFIYRLDVDVVEMADATFRIDLERYDYTNALLDVKDWVSSITPSSDGELVFTSRRLPEDDHYLLKFTMQRETAASGTATVIIDNFRRDHEQLFISAENAAPQPNPVEWAVEPFASGLTTISMEATPGYDLAGTVQYSFEETSGNPGGSDSGWTFSNIFTDDGLQPGLSYTYVVRMREEKDLNTTTDSTPVTVVLPASTDTEPPAPAMAMWALVPTADGDTTIRMEAVAGTDVNGPVEYYFEETSGNIGGSDSGWLTSPTYLDTGLKPATSYSYLVRMRDAIGNVGADSAVESTATTDIEPPLPFMATWGAAPEAISDRAITMASVVGSDANGPVEYSFEEVSGQPGGSDSGWLTQPVYTDTGLRGDTEYSYRVRMRDASGNFGAYSSTLTATTLAEVDSAPPSPNPPEWALGPMALNDTSVAMQAMVGNDESGPVEYYFEELSGNPGGDDSGWQTSPVYTDEELNAASQYIYRIQMRDASGNAGRYSEPRSASTLAPDLLEVTFGALSELKVVYNGADVTPQALQTGTKDEPVITVSGIDVDGMGGTNDSVTARFTVAGTPLVDRKSAGYVLDGGYSLHFEYGTASVTLGNGSPDGSLIVPAGFTKVKCSTADPYDLSSTNPVYSDLGEKNDASMPHLLEFDISSASTNDNRLKFVAAEFKINRQPPDPDPPTWTSVPTALSGSAITMTAAAGSDASGPVEYLFEEVSGREGGSNSVWQTTPVFTNNGLLPGTEYAYRLRMRDANGIAGRYSSPAFAITLDTQPPSPSPAAWRSVPVGAAVGAISMAAEFGFDPNGPVEYYFEETSGNPGGADSGWQTHSGYVNSGLNPNTLYSYRVMLRDTLGNVGEASTTMGFITLSVPGGDPIWLDLELQGSGLLTLTWPSQAGQSYRLLGCTNLVSNSWTTNAAGLSATPPTNSYGMPIQEGTGPFYLKLEVE